MNLDARLVRADLGVRGLDVTLDVPAGRTLALLGANGSGKSSTLAMIAGLTTPDTGFVRVGERALTDTRAKVVVPPHRRRVALLGQQPLLLPHLSVEANVAFAPRSRGVPRRAARHEARRWLAAVDAGDLATRRPHQLSGGQAQRVALARALAARPDVLLLDEPFSALDVQAAPAMRALLARVLADAAMSTVLVTHDLLDALALADEIAVLEDGRVVERGPARVVLASPRSAFAARLAGVNLVAGRYAGGGVLTTTGGVRLVGVADDGLAPGAAAVALFRPGAVALHTSAAHGSPRNMLAGVVEDIADQGGVVRVRVTLDGGEGSAAAPEPGGEGVGGPASGAGFSRAGGHGTAGAAGGPVIAADITPAALADLTLAPGSRAVAVVKAQEVGLHAGPAHA